MKHFAKTQSSKLLIIACVYSLLHCACQPTSSQKSVKAIQADHYFSFHLGGVPIYLQLALTDSEQAQGLMHRPSLDPNHGMLFVFQNAQARAFWMRNTQIPLDLAYLDPSGTILEIHKLYPFDERPVPSRSKQISLVLEMNRGWFNANKINIGSQMNGQSIRNAIQKRGFDPEKFAVNWNSQALPILP
ncbi:MAG: DUF192 domain-containing protein [Coraliomargaritaceae bacterium]